MAGDSHSEPARNLAASSPGAEPAATATRREPGDPASQPVPEALPEDLDAPSAGTCAVCGNHYDKAFTVVRGGRSFVFDCFECAIHALAPSCAHCGCRIVGHGMESGGAMFCCSHCAEARGVVGMKDRT